MRAIISACCCFFLFVTYAQTGPAGVGSSSSNVLWLDANSGVVKVGTAVSQWNDRSGNANHALLPGSIPTAKPTYVSASVNGYPSLNFDGSDDQLWVNHTAGLNLTQWTIFMVVRADVQKNYNAWMVKGDDGQENFELLSYNDGNLHTPVYWTDGSRTFPSSAGGQVSTATFEVLEYSYKNTTGRRGYKNNGSILTDSENKTPQSDAYPIYLGNERSTSGRCIDGDIAEVIIYNTVLNSAQRIIVNNYLATKYARSLSANDIYVQDNVANGDHDHEMAGIGRVDASNTQTDSRGSSVVQITKNSPFTGLDDNEFLLWGHNNAGLGTWGVSGLPTGVQGRWQRVWRVNEVNATGTAVDVGAVDITFDLTGFTVGSASDLRLLVDANNNNNFADDVAISGATAIGSGRYRFAGVTALANDLRFTLGTSNLASTPMPIELIDFTVTHASADEVDLQWSTASEHGNDHFDVERSADGSGWITVAQVPGAITSLEQHDYAAADRAPMQGLSYYRLRQVDVDGQSTLSGVVPVNIAEDHGPLIFPVPASDHFTVVGLVSTDAIELFDGQGRGVPARVEPGEGRNEVNVSNVPPGLYCLRTGARSVPVLIER